MRRTQRVQAAIPMPPSKLARSFLPSSPQEMPGGRQAPGTLSSSATDPAPLNPPLAAVSGPLLFPLTLATAGRLALNET